MKKELIKIAWLIGEIIVFVLISGATVFALTLIFGKLFPELYAQYSKLSFKSAPYPALVMEYIPQLFAYLGSIFIIQKWFSKNSLDGHGLNIKSVFKLSLKGWILAMVLIVFLFLFLLVFGQISHLEFNWNVSLFTGFLLLFIVQSSSEEVMTRSFLVPIVKNKYGIKPAVLVSGLLFAILHIGNPNISLIGIWNIYLAGIMFALFLIKYQSIWIVSFLHAGWNFMQGSFFDFNVSGIDFWSFIEFDTSGVEWLTGGSFGVEGSFISMLLLMTVIVWLLKNLNVESN